MESESGAVVWVLLALAVAAVLAMSAIRWVPQGHRLVATRRGVVSRVAGPGLFLRVPGAEQVVLEVADPAELPLAVHATSRDGTHVRLLLTALVRRSPPAPALPYVDPWNAASPEAERVLGEVVESTDLCDLAGVLEESLRSLLTTIDEACRPRGVEVLGLDLVELDALLAHPAARGSD